MRPLNIIRGPWAALPLAGDRLTARIYLPDEHQREVRARRLMTRIAFVLGAKGGFVVGLLMGSGLATGICFAILGGGR